MPNWYEKPISYFAKRRNTKSQTPGFSLTRPGKCGILRGAKPAGFWLRMGLTIILTTPRKYFGVHLFVVAVTSFQHSKHGTRKHVPKNMFGLKSKTRLGAQLIHTHLHCFMSRGENSQIYRVTRLIHYYRQPKQVK